MSENQTAAGPARLMSLQVLRGIAALMVVGYHSHLILAKPEYGAREAFGTVASRGWTGVNFFFVLSGFIILHAHTKDIGRADRARYYLIKRFFRVYPIYWVILILFVIASALGMGHSQFRWAPGNLLSAFVLVRLVTDLTLPLQVAWTLFFEVAFYAAFLLFILNRAVGAAVCVVWFALICSFGLINVGPSTGWYVSAWNLYFAFGALAYGLFRVAPPDRRLGYAIMGLGLATFAALAIAGVIPVTIGKTQEQPAHLLFLAVPFTLLIAGASISEKRHPWRVPLALTLLGDASYSIYLVHSAVISLLASIMHHRFPASWSPSILFGLAFCAATLAGIAAHLFVERPLMAWLRASFVPRRKDLVAQ